MMAGVLAVLVCLAVLYHKPLYRSLFGDTRGQGARVTGKSLYNRSAPRGLYRSRGNVSAPRDTPQSNRN